MGRDEYFALAEVWGEDVSTLCCFNFACYSDQRDDGAHKQ